MKQKLPDLDKFERNVFKKKNALDLLLSFSLKLMQARHAGLLFGTNKTCQKFLPPDQWDRGDMHKFDGKGLSGLFLKYFGTFVVRYKGLSPVRLYRENTQSGAKRENNGIISFVLRKHSDFYGKGVKILIIDNIHELANGNDDKYSNCAIQSYDGEVFKSDWR